MKWFDESSYVQTLPQDVSALFEENGWSEFLKYRVRNGLASDVGQKYADVRLFKSVGSDRVRRHLGMVFGYDTGNTLFADGRHISEGSPLGMLGVADGVQKEFRVQAYPIDNIAHFELLSDGAPVNKSKFELVHDEGLVRFHTAPTDGEELTVAYKLASTAPEPPSYFVFFTFDAVNLARMAGGDVPINIADGDGVKKVYYTPTKPIKQGTMQLYIDGQLQTEGEDADFTLDLTDGKITFAEPPRLGAEITAKYVVIIAGATLASVGDGDGLTTDFWTNSAPIATNSVKVYLNGVMQTSDKYTVDHEDGKITLNAAPALGVEITVSYIDLTGGAPTGTVQLDGDLSSSVAFDPQNPKAVMDVVYRSLDYQVPSLPTVVDFANVAKFGRGWQRDSYIYNWGNINKNRCMMFFRPDPSADAETALFTPLYFGRLHNKGLAPRRNMIIAGGAAPIREIKWEADVKLGDMIVDYGKHTSNGNQGVQLMQGIGGAYYQQHYLKFYTASQKIGSEGRSQPSSYSGMYHTSQFKITHPNDGDVGYLDDVMAVESKNIHQGNEMETEREVFNELAGIGDGMTRVFHVRHSPFQNEFQSVRVGCLETEAYTYDPDTKSIRFVAAPMRGEEILLSYAYSHLYQFNKPTAPQSPFTLEKFSPHTEIGIAILKDPQKPRKEVEDSGNGDDDEGIDGGGDD